MEARRALAAGATALASIIIIGTVGIAPEAGSQTTTTPTTTAPAAKVPDQLVMSVAKGRIGMLMIAPVGSVVTFFETVNGAREQIGPEATAVPPAAGGDQGAAQPLVEIPWRCDRTERGFTAVARTKDGKTIEVSNEARTPDCQDRLSVTVPRRIERGRALAVTLKDRFQIGDLRIGVCVTRPKQRTTCDRETLTPGQRTLSFERAGSKVKGLLSLQIKVAGQRQTYKIGVGRDGGGKARPTLLVTGDSMVQGIDAILGRELKDEFRVTRDTRPATGVSKDLGTPWTTIARQQVSRARPVATIVLLGGNDGFPMKLGESEVRCCTPRWQQEYLRRLQVMAQAYERGGAGRVIWSLLPPVNRSDLQEPIAAVNASIRRLAETRPKVRLVALDRVFGPMYRAEIDGQKVRDPDGLHFSLAGQKIAAKAIIDALRGPATSPDPSTTTEQPQP